MANAYQLLLRPEGATGPLSQQIYDGHERVEVRDLTMRMHVQVRVEEISPYRHVLLIEGKTFQILNIVRH